MPPPNDLDAATLIASITALLETCPEYLEPAALAVYLELYACHLENGGELELAEFSRDGVALAHAARHASRDTRSPIACPPPLPPHGRDEL